MTPLLPTPQSRDHKDQVVEQSDSHRPGDTDSVPRAVKHLQTHDFGPYQAAVDRWAAILDRPAPPPTTPGPDGRPRLNPRLVEWMMGLPSGWVCDAPGITRTQALKALGNGVVPQQAAAALRRLAGRLNG